VDKNFKSRALKAQFPLREFFNLFNHPFYSGSGCDPTTSTHSVTKHCGMEGTRAERPYRETSATQEACRRRQRQDSKLLAEHVNTCENGLSSAAYALKFTF